VPRADHILCELFEQVAVGLQTIIDAPSEIHDDER
jgi:hypothetical protein